MNRFVENWRRTANLFLLHRSGPRHTAAELYNCSQSMLKIVISVRVPARRLLLAFCLCVMPNCSPGQIIGAVCDSGAGQFSSGFNTGIIVTVGAQKDGGFASRACEASLVRGRKEIVVARSAAQVDIDVLGADLGLGMPVVAFQIERSESDVGTTFEVYSLRGLPRLLRTLTKGDSYRAADTNLNGRIEIWTRDAVAVNRFDDIPLSGFEVPPTIVLRFENQHLVDVSSQFRPYYDQQIAQLRAQLDSGLLGKFKNCDGQLSVVPPEELNDLLVLTNTKINVLEIVWAYLYSGREEDAWRTLADLWPASDFGRIRKAIESARDSGIRSEIDAEVSPVPPPLHIWHAEIYNLATQYVEHDYAGKPAGFTENSRVISAPLGNVTAPVPIYMFTPSPPDIGNLFPPSGVFVDLILDAAGKVSSAKVVNKADTGLIGEALIKTSRLWKFIPAMKNGQPVASHIRMTVFPYR